MFSFLINFVTLAGVIGEVIGVFGTMAGIAEIYLYEPKVPIEGGEEVTQASIEDGSIKLKDLEFTYPTK
jgi:hypothetical protein